MSSKTDSNFSLTITLYILIATAASYLIGKSTLFNSSTLSMFQESLSISYGLSIVLLVFCYIFKQLHEEYEVKLPDTKFPIFTQVIHHFDQILLIDLFLTNCLLLVLVFPFPFPIIFIIASMIILLNLIPNLFYIGFIAPVVTVQLFSAFVLCFISIIKKIYHFIKKNVKHKG